MDITSCTWHDGFSACLCAWTISAHTGEFIVWVRVYTPKSSAQSISPCMIGLMLVWQVRICHCGDFQALPPDLSSGPKRGYNEFGWVSHKASYLWFSIKNWNSVEEDTYMLYVVDYWLLLMWNQIELPSPELFCHHEQVTEKVSLHRHMMHMSFFLGRFLLSIHEDFSYC